MQVKDATFLVTGGASGLGAATARALVAAGGKVVLADLNEPAGRALAKELGAGARFVAADITDETSVSAAIAQAQTLGTLRGAVNCAGILLAARVLGKESPHDLDAFARVVQVNLVGTFNVIRLAAAAIAEMPPLADGERGIIINTASVAAFEGQIGQAAYAAAKGGVVSMTLPIARELARFGIRVVSIAPGIFETPMMEGLSTDAQASLAAQVPFPARLGNPDEFAALVLHAIENRMLNGTTIRLDGAIRMGPK